MDEATQPYHIQLSDQSRTQIVRTIIAMAMLEARKETEIDSLLATLKRNRHGARDWLIG
jgi:hypothetical protein